MSGVPEHIKKGIEAALQFGRAGVSVGSIADGYPCPKDGTTLELIEGKGAWCPKCHTVWTEVDEVEMPRANGAPCPTCGRTDYPHECWRRRVEASGKPWRPKRPWWDRLRGRKG